MTDNAPRASGRPARILIADDDESLRRLIRLTVSTATAEIAEAADGETALALARELRPDVVLLDWTMPGMSGLEVCAAMRRDPDLARATIIMITAHAFESDRQAVLAAGADHYIAKPFSPHALLSLLHDVL